MQIDPLIRNTVIPHPRAPRMFAFLGSDLGYPECTHCGQPVHPSEFHKKHRCCPECFMKLSVPAPKVEPTKFKKGDRVRCIDVGMFGRIFVKDGEYVVSGMCKNGYVGFEGVQNGNTGWYADRFELVRSAKSDFKIGDLVRCISDEDIHPNCAKEMFKGAEFYVLGVADNGRELFVTEHCMKSRDGYAASRFELIQPAPQPTIDTSNIAVGDVVDMLPCPELGGSWGDCIPQNAQKVVRITMLPRFNDVPGNEELFCMFVDNKRWPLRFCTLTPPF